MDNIINMAEEHEEDSWRVERTGGEWGQAQQINNTGEQVHQLCQLSNYVSSKIFLYYIRILQWKLRLKGFFNLTKKTGIPFGPERSFQLSQTVGVNRVLTLFSLDGQLIHVKCLQRSRGRRHHNQGNPSRFFEQTRETDWQEVIFQ